MSPASVLAWAAFAYFLLRAIRYLLAARVYLTCALREVEARPVDRQELDPGELRLLTLLDDELLAAGFRPLGFGSVSSSVTYFGGPLMASVFVNERIPAYAFVHRHLAPENGRLVELDARTALASGDEIVTANTPSSSAFVPPGMYVEALPELSVAALVERHAVRVEAETRDGTLSRHSTNGPRVSGAVAEHSKLQAALVLIATSMARVRSAFRERKWVVPTINPHLDRFTVRGAFALTRMASRKGASRTPRAPGSAVTQSGGTTTLGPAVSQSAATTATPLQNATIGVAGAPAAVGGLSSDKLTSLRVEADLQAILHVAEHPEAAPGTPWPLVTVVAATALLSFVAMAALWGVYVAALILAVITFHEAGHAFAMRLFGYRDVHVFFVPLLGAMTIGRPAVTTVRDRLVVLLAGPVPGLFLAVLLLAVEQAYEPVPMLRRAALAFFILNGLNLLPFTPLDGGRVLETLTRPESVWRPVVHGLSVAGLLALAAFLQDPIVAVVGVAWVAMLPRSWASYKLRKAVAARVHDRGNFRSVARAALEVMSAPRYVTLRAVTRQVTARAIGRLFAESLATPADRRWGAVVYAAAWLLVVAAVMLWRR